MAAMAEQFAVSPFVLRPLRSTNCRRATEMVNVSCGSGVRVRQPEKLTFAAARA